MDYQESKWQRVLAWVYLIVLGQLIFVLGFLLGLGVFSLVPALVTVFAFFQKGRDYSRLLGLKIIPFAWQTYKKALKKYWKDSFLFTLLLLILMINFSYLQQVPGVLGQLLYYVTLILLIIAGSVLTWYAYLSAHYPEKEKKEILHNAIAYPLARMIEMLILFVFIVAVELILWEISIGLFFFAGLGTVLAMQDWVYGQLVDGRSLQDLRRYWRREDV